VYKSLFFPVLLFIPSLVMAIDYGVTASFSAASFDDPDGSNTGSLNSIDLNTSYDLRRRGQSVIAGIGVLRGDASASDTAVNIDSSGYYVYSEYERRIPVFREFSETWLAIGGRFSVYDYTSRYTETFDGYLNESFNDRSEQSLEISGRIGYKINHARSIKSFPAVYIMYPITGSVATYGLSYRVSF